MKIVRINDDWGQVMAELGQETCKLQSYDLTLLELLGDVKGKKIIDYGCGPGVLVAALQEQGAEVKAFDVSALMRQKVSQKIGHEHVYTTKDAVPDNTFDIAICNLVACIVEDSALEAIAEELAAAVTDEGKVYVGFCNPHLYDCIESQLDIRQPTGCSYEQVHVYEKIKKEGGYKILEMHRPLSWYQTIFKEAGLEVVKVHFTPAYEFKGRSLQDFAIIELKRAVKREK